MKKISISGIIGMDVKPSDIKRALTAAMGDDINVDISSPGGLVFDSIEIFNAFRDYRRSYPRVNMEASIKSIAASGASYIAANNAFNKVTTEDNAALMIHNSQGMTSGDRREMKKYADTMESIDAILAAAYAERSGISQKKIREMMDEETWLFGREIVDSNFAHEVIQTGNPVDRQTALASAKAQFGAISSRMSMDIAAQFGGVPNMPVNDGLTPEERLYRAELNASRIADGLTPLTWPAAAQGAPDGIIVTEADYQAELRRSRRLAGLPV